MYKVYAVSLDLLGPILINIQVSLLKKVGYLYSNVLKIDQPQCPW